MKKLTTLIMITGLAAAGQLASAADITGTITLKGTPPEGEGHHSDHGRRELRQAAHDGADDAFLRGRGRKGSWPT